MAGKIYHDSEILRLMIDQEKIALVGAIYDVTSGKVNFDDYAKALKHLTDEVDNQLVPKMKNVLNRAIETPLN